MWLTTWHLKNTCKVFLVFLFIACSSQSENNDHEKFIPPYAQKQRVISIRPIGTVDKAILDSVTASIKKYYGFKVEVRKPVTLPASFKSPRGPQRYRADSIIRLLRKMDTDCKRVVGITGLEIATTKHDNNGNIKKPEWRYKDWGIFGLGFCPGRSCVVSYCYLKRRDLKLLNPRVRKITIHEVGHTLGLPHCPNKNCVMTDACESILTIDKTSGVLCKKCRMMIHM